MLPCNFMVTNVAIWRPQFCFGFVCLHFCVRSFACFRKVSSNLCRMWDFTFISKCYMLGLKKNLDQQVCGACWQEVWWFTWARGSLLLFILCCLDKNLQWCCTYRRFHTDSRACCRCMLVCILYFSYCWNIRLEMCELCLSESGRIFMIM